MAKLHTLTRAAALLLLAAGLIARSQAMPMHPDLLSFVKLPMAVDPSAELEQTAGRKLQQLFEEGDGPFTFDGFGFGYGGIFPGGGFFDGFGVNIYNIIFRDILNIGLNNYVADAVTNNPVQPLDFIPPTFGRLLNRNVVALFGYDAVDKYIGQYLTRAQAKVGGLVEAGCAGPTCTLTVNGGSCQIKDDGSVECERPSIKLSSTPYTCNLPYRGGASLKGQTFRYKVQFGRERKDEIGLPAGEYNFGAAVNITAPYLGISLATARIADSFGVQQWYLFGANAILNELLRVQSALLSNAVDSRILTRAAQDAANQRGGIAEGATAVVDATGELLDRIAQAMGIDTQDLRDGLKAVDLLPGSAASAPAVAPQQPQPGLVLEQDPAQRTEVVNDIVPNTDDEDGSAVVTQSTDEQEGDMSMLEEPIVTKAEGAQP